MGSTPDQAVPVHMIQRQVDYGKQRDVVAVSAGVVGIGVAGAAEMQLHPPKFPTSDPSTKP